MGFPPFPPQQQIEIKLRTPRSGNVKHTWDHEQSDANLMLKAKQHKNINLGSASLVGEIAQIVANAIFLQNNSSFIFGGVTFSRNGTDIMASFGPYGSYVSILASMQKDQETAEQILTNLSKGCIMPDENGNIPLDELENEIFEGLNDSAKKLMAVLICETIRFNDDGACARMAMRLVINRFKEGNKMPFEDVFVRSKENTTLSIFAASGGKSRMKNQIIGYESAYKNDSFFEQDKAILEKNKNFISDDESDDKSDDESDDESDDNFYDFSLNTYQPSIHPMQTRDRGVYSQGFYKDPPTSPFSSPVRPQSREVTTFGNPDARPFYLDKLSSEEQETDIFEPLGDHFCQNCKLLYWQVVDRSDESILDICPKCGSSEYVEWVPDECVARMVIDYMIKKGGKMAYFENDIEGILFKNE